MSGDHFNWGCYFQLQEFIEEINEEIEKNNKPIICDEYKDYSTFPRHYSPETVKILKKIVKDGRKLAKLLKAVDYLYSDDYSEESFLEKIKEINKEK